MGSPWLEGNLCSFVKTDPQFTLKCSEIAADIHAGRLQLVKLVESLGELLTNSDSTQRALGTQVLSLALKEIPPDFLSEKELKFLCDFFCDRLKDHHDVLPAVFVGILAISNMPGIPKDVPSRLLSTIFLNVNCQSQRQTDRYVIYQILQCLISSHLNDVKEMGADLVFGIISAMDGERDPRNLMLLFSMLPSILTSLPLGHLTEEFFEVMACYFPVDFKPSADDPGSVTRDDLAIMLSSCLTAVPQFAEFCLPLLLEKLDSSLLVAKLDSLYLLQHGCKVFKADDLAVHLSPLWMSLSREALTNGQPEVREAAQSAVSALLHNFAVSPVANNQQKNGMQQLLGYIINAATSTLNEIETNLYFPSTQLLLAASKSCRFACETVVKKVVPLLCQYYTEKSSVSEKVILLQTITMFLVTCLAMKVTQNDDSELKSLWASVVQLYISAAQYTDSLVRKEAFHGLSSLGATLSSDERQHLYHVLCLAVDSDENGCVRVECEHCLCHIASLYPDEVLKNIIFERLTLPGISVGLSPQVFEHRLSARCRLAALEPITMHVLPSVVDMIVASSDLYTVAVCISSLRKLLKSLKGDKLNNEFIYDCFNKKCNTISRLLNWWLVGVQTSMSSEIFGNEALLADTSALLRDIVTNLKSSDQLVLVNECVPYYLPLSDQSKGFDFSSPPYVTQTVLLLEAVVGSLLRDVSVPYLCDLCRFLVNLAVRCPDTNTSSSACRLTATLLNKTGEDVFEEILSITSTVVDSVLSCGSWDDKARSASLLGWITKGLLMRGFKNVQYWIDKLLSLLGDRTKVIAMSAAEAFHVIMDESPVCLNSQSHCTVKILYRQRFFQCSSKLLEEYHNAPVGDRSCYLLALAHLLQGVPQTVLTNNLVEVLPLLFESLALESAVLLLASLNTLQILLNQPIHKDHLVANIQTMIPRLLNLTSFKSSLKIRIGSIKCLSLITSFPVQLILPFKYEVVTQLLQCLDDPKRLVRKEAVKARTHWILLDAPGNSGK